VYEQALRKGEIVEDHRRDDDNQLFRKLSRVTRSVDKLGMANGCFDPLEVHHMHVLREGSAMGKIVVALNSDHYVRRTKQREPRRLFMERALSLLAVHGVVMVIGFNEDTPQQLFSRLNPAFVLRGGQKEDDEIVHNVGGCPVITVPVLLDDSQIPLSSTWLHERTYG
jgi:bifunctional ADP-heptose synthase (sugar kinase/adenylyltransferase)